MFQLLLHGKEELILRIVDAQGDVGCVWQQRPITIVSEDDGDRSVFDFCNFLNQKVGELGAGIQWVSLCQVKSLWGAPDITGDVLELVSDSDGLIFFSDVGRIKVVVTGRIVEPEQSV